MDERLRQTVRERAGYRCEYCCLPQDAEPFFAYHVEHIVARQHGLLKMNAAEAPASRTVAFLREWEIQRDYKGKGHPKALT